MAYPYGKNLFKWNKINLISQRELKLKILQNFYYISKLHFGFVRKTRNFMFFYRKFRICPEMPDLVGNARFGRKCRIWPEMPDLAGNAGYGRIPEPGWERLPAGCGAASIRW